MKELKVILLSIVAITSTLCAYRAVVEYNIFTEDKSEIFHLPHLLDRMMAQNEDGELVRHALAMKYHRERLFFVTGLSLLTASFSVLTLALEIKNKPRKPNNALQPTGATLPPRD